MRCLRCGHETEQPAMRPVQRTSVVLEPIGEGPASPEPMYSRWACEKCGRFHFPDGSLYSNPFKATQET